MLIAKTSGFTAAGSVASRRARDVRLALLSTLISVGAACSSDNSAVPTSSSSGAGGAPSGLDGGTNDADAGTPNDASDASDANNGDAADAMDMMDVEDAADTSDASDAAMGDGGVIQSAIDAAVAKGGTARIYILVPAGIYREVVCVPATAPPITLYSTNADAGETVIVYNNFSGKMKAAGTPANPCTPNASALTFGTAGSATFSAFAPGFQAKNITFQNDVTTAELGATTGTQAVALMTQADQLILENVRVLGHQDTFYAESPNSNTVVREYVKSSFIAGDVDFIFGGATLVVDSSQIEFLSDRKTKGQALAPSTNSKNPYGELVINGMFTADATAATGAFGLGRAWDRSCTDVATFLSTCVASGSYPNGQAVVRESVLDAHVAASPWLPAATTSRAFCDSAWACETGSATSCPANRLFEYKNTGPGSDPTATPPDPSEQPPCSNKRPQLTDTDAAKDVVLNYMAQAGNVLLGVTTDNWDPTAGVGDVSTFTPTITVASP